MLIKSERLSAKKTTVLFAMLVIGLCLFTLLFSRVKHSQAPPFLSQHELPVLHITLPDDPHWDDAQGVLIKKTIDPEWSVLGTLDYYTEDDALAFSQRVKIELQGENLMNYPQKSFRVTMTDDSGNDQRLSYPLFGPESPAQFTSVVLRNDDAAYAKLREQVVSELVKESTTVPVLRGRPVVLYFNERYWGLYFLRERFDSTYFEERFRLPEDALSISEQNWTNPIKGQVAPSIEGSEADAERFNQLLGAVAKCKLCVDFDVADESIAMYDILDYYLLELYFGNGDWPYNNNKVWRYKTEELLPPESEFYPELDGRFRPLFFDFDVVASPGKKTVESVLEATTSNPFVQMVDETFPLRNMFYDQDFGFIFLQRMNELLATTLTPAHTDVVVDTWAAKIRSEMPRQIERWKQYNTPEKRYEPPSIEAWELEVEMLKVYLQERPTHFQQYAEDFFYSQLQ